MQPVFLQNVQQLQEQVEYKREDTAFLEVHQLQISMAATIYETLPMSQTPCKVLYKHITPYAHPVHSVPSTLAVLEHMLLPQDLCISCSILLAWSSSLTCLKGVAPFPIFFRPLCKCHFPQPP